MSCHAVSMALFFCSGPEQMLRINDVAVVLYVRPQTVYRMIQRGQIPWVRVGRLIRVPRDALNEWIAANTQQPIAAPEDSHAAQRDVRP